MAFSFHCRIIFNENRYVMWILCGYNIYKKNFKTSEQFLWLSDFYKKLLQ